MTHSLLFAYLLSAAFVTMWYRRRAREAQVGIFVYLFLCTTSHSVLDALTDGGLGVAFFYPFDTRRYFFSVAVSPVDINVFFARMLFTCWPSE
jgi:inner membrane protein